MREKKKIYNLAEKKEKCKEREKIEKKKIEKKCKEREKSEKDEKEW